MPRYWRDQEDQGKRYWRDEEPANIPGKGSAATKNLFGSLLDKGKTTPASSLTTSKPALIPTKQFINLNNFVGKKEQTPSNPTVGEQYFASNVLPIKMNDPLPKKIGKGLVNALASPFAAAGQMYRVGTMELGSVLSGNGLKSIPNPKETSFIGDILPKTLSKPIDTFAQKHPLAGNLTKMGIETIADPTTWLGVSGGKAMLNPQQLAVQQAGKIGVGAARQLPTASRTATEGAQDLQRASKIPGKMEQLSNGQRVRSLGVTATKSDVTAPEVKQGLIDEMMPEGLGAYDRISNADTLEAARKLLEQDTGEVTRRILSDHPTNATDNAAGMLLVQRAQEAGDYSAAVDLVESMARKATEQGQSIQALSMWSRLTPEGMLRYGQKVIDQANQQNQRLGGKQIQLRMTQETAEKITTLMKQAEGLEGRARDIKTQQALEEIAAQVPASIGRKVGSFQTIMQLLNPKTAIRNIVGNAGFQLLENASDVVGAGIDSATGLFTGNRTKVLPSLITQGKGLYQGGKEGLEDALLGIDTSSMAGGKFDLPTTRTFRNGPLSWAEKALNVELRATDRAFYQAAHNESLRQQMAAAAKSGRVVEEPTEAMREIAHHDALYRTFQDDNALSTAFVGIKKALNADKEFGVGDFVLKYAKTPANLLARGLDYSPAGMAKVIFEASKPLMGRQFNQKAFVEAFSRSLVGSSAGVGTGAILHRLGIISGGPGEDWDVAALENQAGFGEYRLNVSGLKRFVMGGLDPAEAKLRPGDVTINYDWFQPWSIPLAIGADIDANKGQAKGVAGTLVNAFATGVNAFADQPVMQGLQTAFGQREPADAIPAILEGVPASFVPTLLNQVKQLVDGQKRNAYDPSFSKETMNRATTRIPGLSDNLPQSFGTLGQPLTTYQPGSRLTENNLWNVFFNPAFVNKYAPSAEAQMVIDLYKTTGETSQVPRVVKKYFSVSGKKIELTAQEYSNMQRQVGELTQQGFSRIPTGINDQEKIKRMGAVMEDAGREARITVLEGRGLPIPESWQPKPGGPKYLLKAIENGDQAAIEQGITAYARNGKNAYQLYTYCQDAGYMDENGQPTPTMQRALALAWQNQGKKQASSAAYSFLLDACKENNEQEARRWAGVIKSMGKDWGNVSNSIRSRSVVDKRNTKNPSLQDIYQGGYKIDPQTVARAQWAMNQ